MLVSIYNIPTAYKIISQYKLLPPMIYANPTALALDNIKREVWKEKLVKMPVWRSYDRLYDNYISICDIINYIIAILFAKLTKLIT